MGGETEPSNEALISPITPFSTIIPNTYSQQQANFDSSTISEERNDGDSINRVTSLPPLPSLDSPKKKPLPSINTLSPPRKTSKPLPPRPTQTSTEINNLVFSHPSAMNTTYSSDNFTTNNPSYPSTPPKVLFRDYTENNLEPASSINTYNYEFANINPEPISHIFTNVDGSMHRSSSFAGTLVNRRSIPSNVGLNSIQEEAMIRTQSYDKFKLDELKKQGSTAAGNNNGNNNNKRHKKIFYNTEFLEKCGFSNNSIEQQQIKQLKQDELQEEQIRRMHSEQEQKMKQMELEELALVNRTLQQEFSFSEFLTSQPKYSWSDFFAHNKNAFSLIRAMASQWSWGEMTLGLEYFARSKGKMKRDFTQFKLESDLERLPASNVEVWRHYARLTYQVFRDSIEDIPRNTRLELHKIIAYDRTQQAMRPGYFLCVDDYTKSVLVIFRGTKSFSDILTDLHCSSIRYKHGYCHKGILTAAQYFDSNKFIKEVVKRTLEHHPGYKLRLLGHSLGGGTAAILSTMWKKDFPDIHCYAFACPPVLSQILADECADYVTSFVNGDDFVTRLSMTAVHELRKEVQNYPWKEEMMKDIQNSTLGKFAAGVKNYASGLFSGLFGGSKKADVVEPIIEVKKDVIKTEPITTNITTISTGEDAKRIEYDQSNSSMEDQDISSSSNADDVQSTDEPLSSISQSTNDDVFPSSGSTVKRKVSKKPKRNPDSPLIINDYENLVVTLFPAGCVYQIRNIDDTVYIKKANKEDITSIILSDSYKEDHRMINYLCNLDAYNPITTESSVI
ncbi:predicted protein [Naegleria gruberi]|uniref:sn-1-specific diacylglycerol lipase n=1 Tax=Naegleria gruberi TaxID=5762 RepID=D2VG56_NAEGR|nr:uncharacterized protein NAEGRDRAFT_58119 [Naegleria gruberi]EFC44212.1 predicted protein [Naegleria gruberi]|eukprot:XP_002676956.1 predicted protein [Naegleria gruberi strain NEG-M]